MATEKLNNELMQHILDEAAWGKLSEELAWSEQLLEKYEDKVDWKEISGNNSILWTVSMLDKFKRKIDWIELSRRINSSAITPFIIEKFKEYWNWKELSSNTNIKLSYELLDCYVERWDWAEIIDRYRENLFDEEFLYRYQEYIPISKLQDSRLWQEIVEIRKTKLIDQILSK